MSWWLHVLLGESAEFGLHVHRLINVVVSRIQASQVALLLAGAHFAHQHEELARCQCPRVLGNVARDFRRRR